MRLRRSNAYVNVIMGPKHFPSIISLSVVLLLVHGNVLGCAPPGFIPSQDPVNLNQRCADLTIYPFHPADQSDQYRFDYSDTSFGNTHNQGATVTVSCTDGGQQGIVEGYDQQRSSIMASPALIATCTNVGGVQLTWTMGLGRILQYVDCRT